MKVGDLVKYSAPPVYEATERGYAASGVVTDVRPHEVFKGCEKTVCRVLWADGRHTIEWGQYLKRLG